ncbi:hypothetical protein JW906_12750 [bacterium]|nr:hypothetical protein [bacterium]
MKRPAILMLSAVLIGLSRPAYPASVSVPLHHRVYAFLERMETRRLLSGLKDGTRPFDRETVAGYLRDIDRAAVADPAVLSRTERDFLERFKGEFCDEPADAEVRILPGEREPHFYAWQKGSNRFYADAVAGGLLSRTGGDPAPGHEQMFRPYYGAIFRGRAGAVGFWSDNRIEGEWGLAPYDQHYKPSLGYPQNIDRDSTYAIRDFSDSYLAFRAGAFRFQFGRDRIAWGPGETGLLISGDAPSLDLFRFSVPIGNALFSYVHGELKGDVNHKWFAAHRLELGIGRFLDLGISESVLYANRGIEAVYLNPLIPYLVAEHTLGDRDNNTLSLDFQWRPVRNVELYGEAFIDDLFSPLELFGDYYGNKLAFTGGFSCLNPAGFRDSGLRLEYTRIEPYVYTHLDSFNVYEHYNRGIGHFLEPNSDMLFCKWEWDASLRFGLNLFYRSIRHGSGDRRTPHESGEGEAKAFLGGTVEKTQTGGISVLWEPVRDTRFQFQIAAGRMRNAGLQPGANRSWSEFSVIADINW